LAEAADILTLARTSGIRTLDTASAYGESERVLGELCAVSTSFGVVTKTLPVCSGYLDEGELSAIDAAFARSLARLGRERVAALLVHDARDLLGRGGDLLWALLERHRTEGRVERIGVSVYDAQEIEAVIARFPVELIQLPLSVFDQRLVEGGTLSRLAARGIAVHARSVLLQGLLLMSRDSVPDYLRGAESMLVHWEHACAEANVTRLEAALAFAFAQPIEGVVVGVHSRAHLAEILAAIERSITLPWSSFACNDANVIDPRHWKQ
jgi:aryl-alcohol dehydrogenase-like predicted oxidoreductase